MSETKDDNLKKALEVKDAPGASGTVEVSIFATPKDLREIADLIEAKAKSTDYGESLTAYTIKPSYNNGAWTRSFTVHFVCDQSRMDCKPNRESAPASSGTEMPEWLRMHIAEYRERGPKNHIRK